MTEDLGFKQSGLIEKLEESYHMPWGYIHHIIPLHLKVIHTFIEIRVIKIKKLLIFSQKNQ